VPAAAAARGDRPVAGLIGNISDFASVGLGSFLTGQTASAANGRVEQFRNNLKFGYGDIISGVSSDGTVFNIRINSNTDYEFSKNLSFKTKTPDGVLDTGDGLAMDFTAVRRRLEQNDLARTAYGLLLASKGEIDETQLNENPAYSGLYALDRKDALDRLNIDTERSFRINGVEFDVNGDKIRITSRPGQATSLRSVKDPEIEALRKKLAKQQEALGANVQTEKVPAKDATINELIGIRESLEQKYTYVAYSFKDEQFIGTNKLVDALDTLAEVPDGLYFGANIAFQIEEQVGNDIPQAAKNELFPVTMNYFSSLVLGAMTGLPTQLREEYYGHAANVLTNVFGGDKAKDQNKVADRVLDVLNKISGPYENAVNRVLDAVSQIEKGAKLDEVRKGLGVRQTTSTYSVPKYTVQF
jgi:hypothetical protein